MAGTFSQAAAPARYPAAAVAVVGLDVFTEPERSFGSRTFAGALLRAARQLAGVGRARCSSYANAKGVEDNSGVIVYAPTCA